MRPTSLADREAHNCSEIQREGWAVRTRRLIAGLALVALAFAFASVRGDAGTLAAPIDTAQFSPLGFGKRSHWLQPWRAYLDTVPAQRLLDSIGINFNVSAREAPATPPLLAAHGFERARLEAGWNAISPLAPTKLTAT